MELRIKSLLWSHPEPCNLPFPFPFRCPQLQELCITFLSSAFTPLWLYSPPLIYSPACPPISTYSKFCHSSEPGSASTYFYNLFSASIPFHCIFGISLKTLSHPLPSIYLGRCLICKVWKTNKPCQIMQWRWQQPPGFLFIFYLVVRYASCWNGGLELFE